MSTKSQMFVAVWQTHKAFFYIRQPWGSLFMSGLHTGEVRTADAIWTSQPFSQEIRWKKKFCLGSEMCYKLLQTVCETSVVSSLGLPYSLKSLSTQKCVCLLVPAVGCLCFTVCLIMYAQNLTLEDCFNIHLLKEESFSVLTLNLSLAHVPMSTICDITTILEPRVAQYVTYTHVMWKLEASSAQTLRTDFTVK